MKTLVLITALVLAVPAHAACNPWAAGSREEQQACLDSNSRNLRAQEQSEAQTQALQDIADQLRAQNILRAGRDQ